MEHCQVKQTLDAAHACDRLAGDLFFCKYRVHHLNLHSSHLKGRFAAVGKLVSGLGATLCTAVLAFVTLVWAFAAVNKLVSG